MGSVKNRFSTFPFFSPIYPQSYPPAFHIYYFLLVVVLSLFAGSLTNGQKGRTLLHTPITTTAIEIYL